MIHISEVLHTIQDNKPHDFIFIAKGTEINKRKGGYKVVMNNSVVTSITSTERKFNLKSLNSNIIRWCYYVLLINFDGKEVYI